MGRSSDCLTIAVSRKIMMREREMTSGRLRCGVGEGRGRSCRIEVLLGLLWVLRWLGILLVLLILLLRVRGRLRL